MYSVELSQKANNFLDSLGNHLRKRIEERLKILSDNAVPHDAKFIGRHEGNRIFRLRIGNYRALYKVKEKENVVLVTKIDKRNRAYQ